MLDLAKKAQEQVARTICNVKVCYDRQFPSMRGLEEESIGASKEAIEFINKVLLRCVFRNWLWS